MKVFVIILVIFRFCYCATPDKFALRELHVLFQKSDHNHDHYLGQDELTRFVESFMKRLPNVFKGVKVNSDAIEGGKALADELFERKDRNEDRKLDFRGSLVSKSEATNFGDEIEKVLINLVHEISEKPPPYPSVNPFSREHRQKRTTVNETLPRYESKARLKKVQNL